MERFTTDSENLPDDLAEDLGATIETTAVDKYVESYLQNEIAEIVDKAGRTLDVDTLTYETILDAIELLREEGYVPDVAVLSEQLCSDVIDSEDFTTAVDRSESTGDDPLLEASGVDIFESSFLYGRDGLLLDTDAIGVPPSFSMKTLLVRNPEGLVRLDGDDDD